jgi:hypothetical protein
MIAMASIFLPFPGLSAVTTDNDQAVNEVLPKWRTCSAAAFLRRELRATRVARTVPPRRVTPPTCGAPSGVKVATNET